MPVTVLYPEDRQVPDLNLEQEIRILSSQLLDRVFQRRASQQMVVLHHHPVV